MHINVLVNALNNCWFLLYYPSIRICIYFKIIVIRKYNLIINIIESNIIYIHFKNRIYAF